MFWLFWLTFVNIGSFSLPRLVRDIFQQGGWSAMGRSCELHWLRGFATRSMESLTSQRGTEFQALLRPQDADRCPHQDGCYIFTYVYLCIYIYIHVYMYKYMCIYIYIYLHIYLFIIYLFIQFYSCIYIYVCVQYMVIHLCIVYSASTCAMPQTLLGWLSFWVTVTVLVAFHYVEMVKLHVPHEASWGTWLPTLCGESADFL